MLGIFLQGEALAKQAPKAFLRYRRTFRVYPRALGPKPWRMPQRGQNCQELFGCGLPSPGPTLERVTSQRGLIYDVVIAYICTGAIPRLGMLSLNRCVKAFGARYTPSRRDSCRSSTEGLFAVPKDFSHISASTKAEALANASAQLKLSGLVRVRSSLPWVDL